VSDGADNASARSKSQMMDLAKQSDAIIYALGIYEPDDPDRSPGVLSELTKTTGGQAFFPEELKDVLPICEQIAHEVRNQYTIVYSPTNQEQDGAYRVIEVRASDGMRVITRAGYMAPLKTAATSAPETQK
jgi:Ca-activated chloride channel family protein